MLGGKRLKFNWDEQSRGRGEAEVGGAVCGWEAYGGAEGVGGPRAARKLTSLCGCGRQKKSLHKGILVPKCMRRALLWMSARLATSLSYLVHPNIAFRLASPPSVWLWL